MSVSAFLNAVLPSQGHRFALASRGKQGDPDFQPGQRHFPVGDVVGIEKYCANGSATGRNCYVAIAGFVLDPNDKWPRRTAHCAQYHRCLRLDIDIGPDKAAKGEGYADRRTALSDLLAFCQKFALPQPWIVDSGGGYHVYWPFDRDVTLAEWLPMAGRLRAACEAEGLLCDHTTTTDAARILRLPGTLNNKPAFVASGNPPVVRVIAQGPATDPDALVQMMPAAPLSYTNPAVPAALRGVGSELTQGLMEPYFLADVLRQCPGLTAMVADGGARASEPLWKKTLDLINKADDPEDLKLRVARGVSCGHRDFDEGEFQRKWALTKAQNYHPPRCAQMRAAGMQECNTCPLWSKISSPLVLGRVRPPAEPATPTLMPPPARPADPPAASAPPASTPAAAASPAALAAAPAGAPAIQSGVFVMDHTSKVRIVDGRLSQSLLIADGFPTQVVLLPPDENGQRKAVHRHMLDYRLTSVERMLDHHGERSVVVLSFDRGLDGSASVEFDNRDFAEPKNFFNKLNARGLYCSRKDCTDFVDKFMTTFLSSLQRARAASQIAGRCGWSDDLKSFVLGSQIFRDDGTSEYIRTSVAPGEMEGYHVAGEYQKWREAFDLCVAGGADRQAVLALAIAGPLMVYTGLDGVLLNAYSPESGVGKSTLCDAALSIWGCPDVLRKDFRDTANATFKLAAVTGNMPMVIDEFTNVEGRALSDYVYTITQGREKHRLTADARLSSGGTSRWCLAAIATANNSVHEKLQQYRPDSTAEAARVFEMRLYPLNLDPATLSANKAKLGALRHSYGHLGPQLVKLFMAKSPDGWRELILGRIAKWDREASSSAGDRFRSACCALIEVGAAIGAALGFGFDVPAVEAVLKQHWSKQIHEFEAERKGPADFLNGYLQTYLADLVTRGGADGKAIISQQIPRKIMGEMRGKTGPNGMWVGESVVIPMLQLREYVRNQNGNYKGVMEWLERNNPAVVRIGRLTFMPDTIYAITTQCVELKHDAIMATGKPKLQVVDNAAAAEVP